MSSSSPSSDSEHLIDFSPSFSDISLPSLWYPSDEEEDDDVYYDSDATEDLPPITKMDWDAPNPFSAHNRMPARVRNQIKRARRCESIGPLDSLPLELDIIDEVPDEDNDYDELFDDTDSDSDNDGGSDSSGSNDKESNGNDHEEDSEVDHKENAGFDNTLSFLPTETISKREENPNKDNKEDEGRPGRTDEEQVKRLVIRPPYFLPNGQICERDDAVKDNEEKDKGPLEKPLTIKFPYYLPTRRRPISDSDDGKGTDTDDEEEEDREKSFTVTLLHRESVCETNYEGDSDDYDLDNFDDEPLILPPLRYTDQIYAITPPRLAPEPFLPPPSPSPSPIPWHDLCQVYNDLADEDERVREENAILPL